MPGWETQVPARTCHISQHRPVSPRPFSHAAPAVAPTSDAAAGQKARVQSQPQHSPASEPTITHTRIMGNTTFAASAKERIHSLCSQTEFNPPPTPSKQKPAARQLRSAQGHGGTRREDVGFWGYFPCFFSWASRRNPHLLWTWSRKEVSFWLTSLRTTQA